jgi:hypothetical protein
MKYAIVTTLAVVLAAGTALADEVRLKSGGRIVGIARVDGDRVVVEAPIGTVTVAASDIASIVPGRTMMHVYDDRYAAIAKSRQAGDFYELAVWAGAQGLSRYVTPLLERAVALDPEHAAAHEMLGHVRHDGRWMTKSECMRARGYVEFRDRWTLPAERDSVLAAEAARRAAQERDAAERRKLEALANADRIPYTLGLPAYGARGSRAWSSGVYTRWGVPWYFQPWYTGVLRHGTAHRGFGWGHGGFHRGGHK